MEDEYLDLVDEDDNVIGKKKRSEIYSESLSNFRLVNAFIVNSKGELWIPRRTADKKMFPLGLDNSMGGHVESGESYEEAFGRELKEELDIDLEKIKYTLLGHLNPKDNKVSAFMKVYEIKMDEAPNYNPEDFVEYFWLTPQQILELVNNGEKSKEDLPKLINIFYKK